MSFPINTRVYNVNKYREYKTKLNLSIKSVKEIIMMKKIESYKNNLRKSWNVIEEVINSKKSSGYF